MKNKRIPIWLAIRLLKHYWKINLLLIIPFAGTSQVLGKWKMPDGSVIERINDTTQIEYKGGRTDTFSVMWVKGRKKTKRYEIKGCNCPHLYVKVHRMYKDGSYKATAYDRRGNRRIFHAKKII